MSVDPSSSAAPSVPPKMMTSIRTSDENGLEIVDQLLLPHVIKWEPVHTVEDAFNAIKEMKIRGAPAIASLAALVLSLLLKERLSRSNTSGSSSAKTDYAAPSLEQSPEELRQWLIRSCDYLESSRPTAVNLSEAMNRVRSAVKSSSKTQSTSELAEEIVLVCEKVHAEDLERNKQMSKLGADYLYERAMEKRGGSLKDGEKLKLKVMTVCNTGSLATSGYGTALGVITNLFETGRLERAYYTQSTPYHQGSRLTSLELSTLRVPACMICDTMVGSLMQLGELDAVVVGADRVVRNGDTANKVGTYQAAVLAREHDVEFMVAAPVATLDLSLESGKQIHIEQRPAIEATMARGLDPQTGKQAVVQITPDGIGRNEQPWQQVYNPSFDVTPAKLIGSVVTEKGVAKNQQRKEAIDLSAAC